MILALFLLAILYISLACYRWIMQGYLRRAFRLYNQPLQELRWITDGVLSQSLLESHIDLPKNMGMMEIDMEDIRLRLESFEQVRHVEVERHFHDRSLQITLEEEKPFARVVLAHSGSKEILYVGENGKVFHGLGFTDSAFQPLPFLTGLDLHKNASSNGYYFDSNLISIRDFLQQCQKNYPQIYSQIRYLSLAHWDPNGEAHWSRLEIVMPWVKRIIFSPYYWEEQWQRLDYLLKDDHLKKCFPIERIDLRLGQEVSIRLRHNRR